MRLYIVRHGETNWNKERRIQGQVDIPLNEFGRHLAVETGKGLEDITFDICFTSPLGRARETASLILNGKDTQIVDEPLIMEMAFADYEGKCCSKEGWELPEGFRKFFNDPANYVPAPGGESFQDVKDRTGTFLKELYKKEEYKDSNILITTHGAALAGLLANIRNLELKDYWGVGVHKNCGVTEVLVEDGVPTVVSENKTYYKDEVKAW